MIQPYTHKDRQIDAHTPYLDEDFVLTARVDLIANAAKGLGGLCQPEKVGQLLFPTVSRIIDPRAILNVFNRWPTRIKLEPETF